MESNGHIQPVIPVRLLESWKGITDPKTRKTLQNRLNQRAYRRRQQAAKGQRYKSSNINSQLQPQTQSTHPLLPRSLDHLDPCHLPVDTTELSKYVPLQELEAVIHLEFAQGSPRADLLLGLTQLNIVRALYNIADILNYRTADMRDDSQSMFTGVISAHNSHRHSLPASLQPTIKQCTDPHHPWLDMIPIPKMRDNLIQAGDTFDDLRLCHDMCGYRLSATGFLIWKEPWDPSGWEVTESFLQVWGWTVRDCWDLFRSTNRWRMRRGEKPLFRALQSE